MSALDAARDHYLERFEHFAEQTGDDPAWLAARRREALAAFAATGLPSTRREEWRYTNVAKLAAQRFDDPSPDAPQVTREQVEALSIPVYACSSFVFVDGRFAPQLSTPPSLAGPVRVESLAAVRREDPDFLERHLGALVDAKLHPFAALGTAFLDDGAVLRIPAGAVVERPIHVVHVATAERPTLQHPRTLVVAGSGSQATLLQDHVSVGESRGFTNAVGEIVLEPGARLDFALLQRESASHFHVSNFHVQLARDARLTSHTVTLGGGLVRNDLCAALLGEGADCTLDGLFVGEDQRVIDNHTLVDHALPHGTSRELYKGILLDGSRGVFRGRIVVRPDAQHTSADQSNPNLLLSDGAEIDTKPQLEIHADDVRCSHGSSIGQVDEDALFYLRARGIGEHEARGLMARGFASEVTARIPLEPLREEIDALVARRLDARAPVEASR